MDIINSDNYFNFASKGKETLAREEILTKIAESSEIGAERYLISESNEYIGILDFLMKNPNDGCTWLGLLLIKKDYQGKGYGFKALNLFYEIMKERNVGIFRIGVIAGNEPAHTFWKRQGFKRVSSTIKDAKEIIIYEKTII